MNNIFVGNLSFKATKEDVVKLFEPFGHVANVLILEGKKGKSRGYGFVDMPNEEEKNAAIATLAGKEFMWRVLSVSSVVPKVKSEVRSNPSRKESRASRSDSTGKGPSKYYNKFDGPPKPWRKDNSGAKPYYGKKREFAPSKTSAKGQEGSKFSTKPKISKGFKMFHKVSGASRTKQ